MFFYQDRDLTLSCHFFGFASQVFENHSNPFFVQKWMFLRRMTMNIFLTECFFSSSKKCYIIFKRDQMTTFWRNTRKYRQKIGNSDYLDKKHLYIISILVVGIYDEVFEKRFPTDKISLLPLPLLDSVTLGPRESRSGHLPRSYSVQEKTRK